MRRQGVDDEYKGVSEVTSQLASLGGRIIQMADGHRWRNCWRTLSGERPRQARRMRTR
jgi:hypothetical protein